jgi:hypothetical protein
VIQEEGLHVFNIHNLVEKHFNMSIAPVRSQSGSLVQYKMETGYLVRIQIYLRRFSIRFTVT